MRETRSGMSAGRLWCTAFLLALVVGAAVPLVAQDASSAAGADRAQLEESYEILPLSDGLALRPREEGAIRILEIRAGEIAVDGLPVSADELRARLGAEAEPLLALTALTQEGRAEWLAAEPAAVAAPAVGEVAVEEPEPAATPERRSRSESRERRKVTRSDAQVVVGSSVTVEEDEVARDVVVVGGSLTVLGRVKGDAVAIGGSIEIDGEVSGDVASIGGSVELEDAARIGGSVVAVGGSVKRSPNAVVEGGIDEVPLFPSLRLGGWDKSTKVVHEHVDIDVSPVDTAFRLAWELFGIGLLLLLALLALLIARNPIERIRARAESEPFKAGLVGLLCQILFFPLLILVVVVLVVSIVGIPFLLLLPFVFVALALICLMGYAAVALQLGRWLEARFGWSLTSPYVAIIVGVALIHVWSLIGALLSAGPGPVKFFAVMFTLFGGLVCYVAWTVGFGAAVLSRFGTEGGWSNGSSGGGGWQQPGPTSELGTGSATEPAGWSDEGGVPPPPGA